MTIQADAERFRKPLYSLELKVILASRHTLHELQLSRYDLLVFYLRCPYQNRILFWLKSYYPYPKTIQKCFSNNAQID